MKRQRHNIEYFLANPYFIDWVKNPSEDNTYFWKKWLENHPGDSQNFHAARTIILRVGFAESQEAGSQQEMILDNILKNKPSSRYQQEKNFNVEVIKLRPWLIKVAAAILLLFGISTFFYNDLKTIGDNDLQSSTYIVTKHSPKGKKTSFYLPDNSKVILNAGSTISYPSQFSPDAREVTLVGEAYFDVQHDTEKKFLVKSGDIITSVHGTAFNVSAYQDEEPTRIALERGLISVYSQGEEGSTAEFYVHPGEKLTVHEDFDKSEKEAYNFMEEFGWKEGMLVFNDASLDQLITKLERWFNVNVSVVGKTSQNWEINGRFKNQSLENVLKSLEFARDVSYSIENKNVTIYIH